jgi:formylmethanofuran dehydrogenase subunit E
MQAAARSLFHVYSIDMAARGSKYNFVSEPDSALLCAICLEVAEDPKQHEECGKLLCKECLEKYGRNKPCPNCRGKQPQYFQDNRSECA